MAREAKEPNEFSCPECNITLQSVYPNIVGADEKVRCPNCFAVFVPYPNPAPSKP